MDNKYQLLRDPKINPTEEIISNGLGLANSAYIEFIGRLKHINVSLMEWRYYNDGKAWLSKGEFKWITNRGTDKVKPIFWLSIWNGFFKISFYFSVVSRSELLTLPISKETKNLIENAKPMGKTMKYISIVFDVNDAKYIDDLLVLSEFRKNNI
jgi:hypothetical protein